MPGMRTKAPFLTTVIEVIVRPTTDKLDTITGVTKDGIANYFKDIQVKKTLTNVFTILFTNYLS